VIPESGAEDDDTYVCWFINIL